MIDKIINVITNYDGNISETELYPMHDSAKSFYGKAYVKEFLKNDTIISCLYSYKTLVCVVIDKKDSKQYILNTNINTDLLFSNTTLRHVKEFLLQKIPVLRLSHYIDGKITKTDIIKNNQKEFK